MDRFTSVLLLRSIGGGTGSGLGSRILEAVREAHPTAVLADAVVAPFAAGDTPTQHYNTILSLAWSARHADATLYFGNDDLLQRSAAARRAAAAAAAGAATPSSIAEARARGLLSERGGAPDHLAGLHTRDLNTVIAEALAAIVLPVRSWRGSSRVGGGGGSSSRNGGAEGLLSRRAAEGSGAASVAAAAAAAVAAARPVWQDTRDPETLGDPHAKAFVFSASAGGGGEGKSGREGGGKGEEEEEGQGEEEEEESEFGARGGWISAAVSARPSPAVSGGGGGTTSAAARNLESILTSGSSGSSSSSSSASSFLSGPLDLLSLLNAVAPSPSHKFLDVRSVRAQATAATAPPTSFLSLSESLLEVLPRYDAAARNVTTRAACLLLRGVGLEDMRGAAAQGRGLTARKAASSSSSSSSSSSRPPPHASMAAVPPLWPGLPGEGSGGEGEWERISLQLTRGHSWLPGADLATARSARLSAAGGGEAAAAGSGGRSLACIGNSDAFVAPLVRTVSRADALLSVGAYVHWYARHGVEREEIMGAMHEMLDVVEAYRPPQAAPSIARRGGAAR